MPGLRSVAASAALVWLGADIAGADVDLMTDIQAFNNLADAHDGFPHQTFRSSPIVAPVFQVNSWEPDLMDDSPYIFFGSVYGEMNAGPMILDARDLSLVYADQVYDNTYTSTVKTINGTRYLTFWEGFHNRVRGHADGYCLLVDEDYNVKYNVSAVGSPDLFTDMHELEVTDEGTIIFTMYVNIDWDCTQWDGPAKGLLMESAFQEVDAETNELLFDWRGTDHFNVNDTHAVYGDAFGVRPGSGFDYFHINSVEKTKDGNYLVSSRHLCMLTLIDGTDGHPIWVLGGNQNQFTDLSDGTATDFCWQHDARFVRGNESQISMFDNHKQLTRPCAKDQGCHTRALHLEIDSDKKTARVLNEYFHPDEINVGAMGGVQTLESGNLMTGWGHAPGFTEFTIDGKVALDVQRGRYIDGNTNDMFFYRVRKGNWTGRPQWPPSVAMDAPHGTTKDATLFVSWNGATDVASWAVFASDEAGDINKYENFLLSANRTGFETSMHLGNNSTSSYIGVAAVNSDGDVLGSSFTFNMATQKPVKLPSNIDSVHPSKVNKLQEYAGPNGLAVAVGVFASAGVVLYLVRLWRRRRSSGNPEWAKYDRVPVGA